MPPWCKTGRIFGADFPGDGAASRLAHERAMNKPEHGGYLVTSQEFPAIARLLGSLTWLVYCTVTWAPHNERFLVASLLLFSPLVLVPYLLEILRALSDPFGLRLVLAIQVLHLPAALLLCVAYLGDAGLTSAALAAPWAVLTILVALWGVAFLIRDKNWQRPDCLSIGAGTLFASVGGGWTLFDRLGHAPLGFDPLIVLLTAMHFHHVGLVVPVASGLVARLVARPIASAAALTVVAGVPLVAAGITVTHLTGNLLLEAFAVCVIVIGLFGLAYCLFVVGADSRLAGRKRLAFYGSSVACATGAVLALLFGLRGYLSAVPLTIATMAKTHGVINAFLFEWPLLTALAPRHGSEHTAPTSEQSPQQFH